MKSLLISLVLSITLSITYGQSSLILEDAIRIALENNYDIQIVKKNTIINNNNISVGNAGMLPKVDVQGSVSNSNTDSKLELASGLSIDQKGNISNNINSTIELSWTLFDGFGMFISYEKFKVLKELSEVEQQMTIENTISILIKNYYEAVRLQQDLVALNENLIISKERLKRVENRAEFGASVKLEVLHAKVDVNRDSSSYLQNELLYSNTKRNLNIILGRNPTIDFVLNNDLAFVELFTIEYILESAMKRNTSINIALKNKRISELDYKTLKAAKYPRIMLNSSYGYNKSETDAGIALLNQNMGLNAGITASMNLFDGFKKNLQTQNAIIAIEISDLQYEEIKKEVELNINNAYDTYLKRFQILELEKQNFETAQQNFLKSKDLYQLGQITSTELREAQLNLFRSKNSINNANFQAKIAETELLLLSSNLFDKLN